MEMETLVFCNSNLQITFYLMFNPKYIQSVMKIKIKWKTSKQHWISHKKGVNFQTLKGDETDLNASLTIFEIPVHNGLQFFLKEHWYL